MTTLTRLNATPVSLPLVEAPAEPVKIPIARSGS